MQSSESPNNRVHESCYDSIMKKTQNARGKYVDKHIDCMLKKAFCLFAWNIRYFYKSISNSHGQPCSQSLSLQSPVDK